MPRKIRELLADLRRAGFYLDRQAGSHRQFKHAGLAGVITVSGGEGADAKHYQERQVRAAIARIDGRPGDPTR
jgi:predicted RNA binding protein YcfA (HicA-like mRNA interferase family)